MSLSDELERRILFATLVDAVGAARVERTARGQVAEVRRQALNRDELLARDLVEGEAGGAGDRPGEEEGPERLAVADGHRRGCEEGRREPLQDAADEVQRGVNEKIQRAPFGFTGRRSKCIA